MTPGLISFDDGNSWDKLNVKNDKSFMCNTETSAKCSLRLQTRLSDLSFDFSGINFGDRLMTPGIASVIGVVSETDDLDAEFIDSRQ